MALGHSPSIVRNGLVFYYDMNNTKKSWKGKPTTNLYTNGHFAGGNHVTQAQNGSLSNPVNEVIAMKNPGSSDYCLRTTSVGGSPYTEYEMYLSGILTANTTYCLSCWYALSPDWNGNDTVFHSRWWNADGSEQGTLGGGGWTVAETKVVGGLTWKRVYITFSTGATTNGNHSWYAGYPAQNTAGYRYFTDFQIEVGSTPTPFSNGARSSVQSLLDLTGNYTLTASNITYNSDGSFEFNGSNSCYDLNTTSLISGTQDFTIEASYNATSGSGGREIIGNYGAGYTSNSIWFATHGFWLNGGVGYHSGGQLVGMNCTAVTRNGSTITTYKNGNVDVTGTTSASVASNINWRIGKDVNGDGEPFAGKIYSIKVYNRALTASEVLQNFNAHRGIYGI